MPIVGLYSPKRPPPPSPRPAPYTLLTTTCPLHPPSPRPAPQPPRLGVIFNASEFITMSRCILFHVLVFSSPFLVGPARNITRGVIFSRGGELRFPSVNIFAVKDEVAGDNDVQLQKHENRSEQRHFFYFFFFFGRASSFRDDTNSSPMAKIPGLKNADVLNNVFSSVLTMTMWYT